MPRAAQRSQGDGGVDVIEKYRAVASTEQGFCADNRIREVGPDDDGISVAAEFDERCFLGGSVIVEMHVAVRRFG